MIEILTGNNRFCDGISRREYLQLGTVGLFGLSLPKFLRANESRQAKAKGAKEISCMLLWLSGGPSQFETFDPKPDAPAEIRGEFSTIPTTIPGVHFSEHLPKLAKQLDKFSLIRSMTHNIGAHGLADQLIMSGYTPNPALKLDYASQGSVVSYLTGYRKGVPPYAFVGETLSPKAPLAGALGAAHDPLDLGNKANEADFRVKDVALPKRVDLERLNHRRKMLEIFDQYQRNTDVKLARFEEVDGSYERAYSLITSPGVKKAFQLEDEPAPLRDAYSRTMFGQSCLLGRRLIEAGVRFVTIASPDWDTHTNLRRLKEKKLPTLDAAYSTLLQDLHDRGMLDSTLVLALGEFGRTPKINGAGGRDHWPSTQVVCIGGGGLKTGVVVGATSQRSEYPVERPLSPQDLCATIYHALGIPTSLEYKTPENRPIQVLKGGEPIRELL